MTSLHTAHDLLKWSLLMFVYKYANIKSEVETHQMIGVKKKRNQF